MVRVIFCWKRKELSPSIFLGGGFKYFYFHPYLGKWSNLTSIFFKGVETTNQFPEIEQFRTTHFCSPSKHLRSRRSRVLVRSSVFPKCCQTKFGATISHMGGFMWNDQKNSGVYPVGLKLTFFTPENGWLDNSFLGFRWFSRCKNVSFSVFVSSFPKNEKDDNRWLCRRMAKPWRMLRLLSRSVIRPPTPHPIVANDGLSWGGTWYA